MIIGLTGMPGAGKSEAARLLEERGFRIVEMGNVVRSLMYEEGIAVTNESFRAFASELRQKHGQTFVAQEIVKKLANTEDHEMVCIAGIRSTGEIDYFKSKLNNIKVIAIVAPKETRFFRLKSRGRTDDPKSIGDFEFREQKEEGWGILGAINAADSIVLNTGDITNLNHELDKALDLETDTVSIHSESSVALEEK